MACERLIVRSYRRVFCIDRRIYRVDRWALPVPGGVPLRGAGYFVAALLAVLVLARFPVASAALAELSPPLRYVIAPLLVAVLATQVAPDGRAAHRFAADWLRVRLRSRRRSAGRRVPVEGERVVFGGRLAVVADGQRSDLVPAMVRGPARVRFGVPVRVSATGRGRWLVGPGATAGPRSVTVAEDEVMEVRQ